MTDTSVTTVMRPVISMDPLIRALIPLLAIDQIMKIFIVLLTKEEMKAEGEAEEEDGEKGTEEVLCHGGKDLEVIHTVAATDT